MAVQHVKGQPVASKYVREKGGVKIPLDLWTPCRRRTTALHTKFARVS